MCRGIGQVRNLSLSTEQSTEHQEVCAPRAEFEIRTDGEHGEKLTSQPCPYHASDACDDADEFTVLKLTVLYWLPLKLSASFIPEA